MVEYSAVLAVLVLCTLSTTYAEITHNELPETYLSSYLEGYANNEWLLDTLASDTAIDQPEWLQCSEDLLALLNKTYVDKKTSLFMLASNAPLLVGSYTQCVKQTKATHCTFKVSGNVQGICLPSSCSIFANKPVRSINIPLKKQNKTISLAVKDISCGDHKETSYSVGTIIMVFICTMLLVLVVIGSVLDELTTIHKKQEFQTDESGASFHLMDNAAEASVSQNINRTRSKKRKSILTLMVLCFSLSRNWKLLVERSPTRKYKALDGIRALSLFGIINGHTLNFQLFVGFQPSSSYDLFKEQTQTVYLVLVYGANLAVDSFFFLSGFLSTLVLYRRLQKKGIKCMQVPLVVLHRYLRLTPTLLFMIGFYYLLAGHMGSGPFWYRMNQETKACGQWWWTNILYINNFYPANYKDTCAPWTWYLANDMQFFVVGLLLVILYYKYPALGYTAMSVVLAGTMVITGVIQNNEHIEFTDTTGESQNKLYNKPYTRIGPYIIGMLTVLLFTQGYWKVSNWFTVLLTHLFSYCLIFICVIAPIFDTHPNGLLAGSWNNLENFFVTVFARVGFTLGLSLLTLLCVSNHGGIADWFLSFAFWDPIAKLTYSAYLIHPVLMRIYYFNSEELYVFSYLNYVFLYLGFLVTSYTCATLIYLCVESPFGELEKLMLEPRKKEKLNIDG